MPHWNFSCQVDASSYDLEIGPTQGMELALQRALQFGTMENASTPGTVMVKPPEAIPGSMKGTLLHQAEYTALGDWWKKSRRIRVTDLRGTIFTVLIIGLDRQRVRVASHPWKHTWTMTVDVLQIIFPDFAVFPQPYLRWADAEGTWDDHTETWTEATA